MNDFVSWTVCTLLASSPPDCASCMGDSFPATPCCRSDTPACHVSTGHHPSGSERRHKRRHKVAKNSLLAFIGWGRMWNLSRLRLSEGAIRATEKKHYSTDCLSVSSTDANNKCQNVRPLRFMMWQRARRRRWEK